MNHKTRKFEDITKEIRSHKSKDKQCMASRKVKNKTDNCRQNTTHKALKAVDELRYSGKINCSCSTNGNCHVLLIKIGRR